MPGSRVRLFTSLLERQRQRDLPTDEAIQTIVDAVARSMDTDVATLYVLDASAGEMILAATRGLARSGVGFVTLKLGEGVSGAAALQRAPVSRANVSGDPVFKVIPGFDQSRYHSILAVPVLLDDELIGALNVQTMVAHEYADAEVQDLTAIAGKVAQTLRFYWREGDLALRLRGPQLLSSVEGIAAASLGTSQIGEQVAAALNAILPETQSVLVLRVDDTLQPTSSAPLPPVLLSALTACVEAGEAVELQRGGATVLALPLRGRRAIVGGLGVCSMSAARVPWAAAHVRSYLEALAERVGVALEPLTARAGSEPPAAIRGPSLYADLVDLVLQDRGLEAVVEAAARACNAQIAVVDIFDSLMAGSLPAVASAELQLTAGGQALARLISSLSQQDAPALDTVAQVVSLELAKSRARLEVEGQLRGGVLELLLSGADIDRRELQARMSLVGLDLRREYTPVMFAFDTEAHAELSSPMATSSLTRAVQRHLGAAPASVAFPRPEGLLVLVDGRDMRLSLRVEKVIEELRFLTRLSTIGTGLGSPVRRPDDYAAAIKKATLAATLGLRLHVQTPVTSEHLGVHGLLLAIPDAEQLREYVQAQLGALFSSDDRNGGELTRTLEAYHVSGERLSVAASLLSVHVNTLKYRLARIESLSGRSLRDPIARFNMYLALYALRLLEPEHHRTFQDELGGLRLAPPANAPSEGQA